MDQFDRTQQKNKPMVDNAVETSMVRTHFASKKEFLFSSNVKPHTKTDETNQTNIFEATNYFSSFQQHAKESDVASPIPPRLSSGSSSVETISSYRTRSFNTTPTTSSEASWNSQAGLLANTPGSADISMIKTFPKNESNVNKKWLKNTTKWLNKGRKCPCVNKKSVQVDERVHSNTMPKMVDLRRSASYNGSSSLYSPRQSSPKTLGTNVSYDSNKNNYSKVSNGGIMSPVLKPKVIGPLTLYDDLAKVNKDGHTSNNNNVVTITNSARPALATATSNGFTFPILENQPIGLKKMFNVIPSSHQNNEDPHPDPLLEVFHVRNHSSPMSRRMSYEDDNAMSDGSSDLFEIESFSTTSYTFRDSTDEVIIVPNSNFGSVTKRHGVSCPSHSNQGGNNTSVDQNNNDIVD